MLFRNFFQFQIETQLKVINQDKFVFPTITVCSTYFLENENSSLTISEFKFDRTTESELDFYERISFIKKKNCLRINGGKNSSGHYIDLLSSSNYGQDNGINLELNLSANIKQIFVYINDNSSLPTASDIKSRSIQHNTDVTYSITHKKSQTILAKPYSECLDSYDNIDIFKPLSIPKSVIYSKAYCLQLCDSIRIGDSCNCSIPGFYERKGFIRCDEQEDDCYLFEHGTELESRTYIREVCQKKCPIECTSVSYQFRTEKLPYRDKDINNTIKIILFTETFKYEKLTEVPRTEFIEFLIIILSSFGTFMGINLFNFFKYLNKQCQILYNKVKKNQVSQGAA